MLKAGVGPGQVIERIFAGLLGACVMYIAYKSVLNLELTIHSLTDHLSSICWKPYKEIRHERNNLSGIGGQ